MFKQISSLILAIFAASQDAYAQETAAEVDYSPGTGLEVIPGYNIQMRLKEDDPSIAVFELYMKDQSWMGLVLGNWGMAPGVDMI